MASVANGSVAGRGKGFEEESCCFYPRESMGFPAKPLTDHEEGSLKDTHVLRVDMLGVRKIF